MTSEERYGAYSRRLKARILKSKNEAENSTTNWIQSLNSQRPPPPGHISLASQSVSHPGDQILKCKVKARHIIQIIST